METVAVPRRFKTFTYHTDLAWTGNRSGILSALNKQAFPVSAPPEFKGEPGVWTPEDLFVASVSICLMTTFMSFASKSGLAVKSYADSAEGVLEFIDERYRFTQVILKPQILLESQDRIEEAERILEKAHAQCLIANSIKAEIHLQPEVKSLL